MRTLIKILCLIGNNIKYILFSTFLILNISFCNTQKLYIQPIVFANSYSNGGIIDVESDILYWLGWGIIGKYDYNNLNIESNIIFTRYNGLNKLNSLSNIQALSSSGHNGSEDYESQSTYMKATYTYLNYKFNIGRFNQLWGPGYNKILLSNKIPPFSQYSYSWKINKKYHLFFMHGKLNSGLYENETYDDQGILSPLIQRPRFVGAHRMLITFSDRFKLGLSELIVYGNRGPELAYNLPFVLFYSLQNYFGDLDNVMVGFDLEYKINNNHNIYSAILIDDLSMSKIFNKNHNNKIALQIGTSINKLFFPEDNLLIELIWTDNRLNTHKYNINYAYSSSGKENNFVSNSNYPLGFWGGPHSEHLYLSYKIKKNLYNFSLSYSYTKRGQVTEEMILNDHWGGYINSEHRFEGPIEKLDFIEFKVGKEYKNNIHVYFSIQHINWINPGFDPFDPNDDLLSINQLKCVTKNSFNIELLYNFKWPGVN